MLLRCCLRNTSHLPQITVTFQYRWSLLGSVGNTAVHSEPAFLLRGSCGFCRTSAGTASRILKRGRCTPSSASMFFPGRGASSSRYVLTPHSQCFSNALASVARDSPEGVRFSCLSKQRLHKRPYR